MGGGGGQSREALFIALLMSLLLSSTLVTFIVNDYTGNPNSLQSPSFDPQYGTASYSSLQQDFTTTNGYNTNYTFYTPALNENGWRQANGVGLVKGLNPYGYWTNNALSGSAMVYIDQVATTGGAYDITYHVNNSVGAARWKVCVRTAGALPQDLTGSDIWLVFDTYGIHIPEYTPGAPVLWPYNTLYDFTWPGANGAGDSDIEVRTVFNDQTGELITYLDGQELFDINGDYSLLPETSPLDTAIPGSGPYFAGAGSDTTGWTITNIEAPIHTASTAASIFDTLNNAFIFIGTLATVIGWTLPEAVLPLWVNIILIKTQVAGLIYMIVQIIRGT